MIETIIWGFNFDIAIVEISHSELSQNTMDVTWKIEINILCKTFFLQLRQEKVTLEQTLEREQEFQVNKLIRRIERLEAETVAKQQVLEQVKNDLCFIIEAFYVSWPGNR